MTNLFRLYKGQIATAIGVGCAFGSMLLANATRNEEIFMFGGTAVLVANAAAFVLNIYDLFHINLRLKNAIKIKHLVEMQD